MIDKILESVVQNKSSLYHVFNVFIAKQLGVEKAIILDHFINATKWAYSISEDSNTNQYYGYKNSAGEIVYYTWGNREIWAEKFPYLSGPTFYRFLAELSKDKYLLKKTRVIKREYSINQSLWSANFQKIDELFGSKRHNPYERIHPAIFIDEYSPKGSYYRIVKFKVDAANELGITGAIILEHFLYFLTHNLKAKSFLYENENGIIVPFVPASAPMLLKYFPFFTERKIRLALDLLEDKKLITLSRIPNKYATTRNLWATLHEEQWHYEK